MDKTLAPNSISSFRISDFRFRWGQTDIRNPKSEIQHPLSILAGLMLFFSNFDILNAQKSPISMMNWQIIGSLPMPNIGVAGAFSGVHNGAMMVAGGANFPNGMPWECGKKQYTNEIFVFIKNRNGKLNLQKQPFNLPNNCAYGVSISTPKGIVCIGGENEKGASNKAFLMQWDTKKQQVSIQHLRNSPLSLTNASATCIGNTIYVVGGESDNKTTNSFLSLDINEVKAAWKILPNLPKPISHAVVVAQSKNIFVMGGRAKTASGISDLYCSNYKYDTKLNIWTPLSIISDGQQNINALTAGTGVAIRNQYIVLFGGDKGETFHQVETLLAAINKEDDEAQKQILIQQKNQLLASHPGFSKDVLLYDTHTDKWTKLGSIPFDSPVTTTAFIWGKRIFIPSGEIRAGVRTQHILAVDIQNEK